MFWLYQSANPTHGLVKIGLTRTPRGGRRRLGDYIARHDLPREGWSNPRHYGLNTNDLGAARAAERVALASYRAKGNFVTRTGRRLLEVFTGTPSGAHWTTLKAAKGSGIYRPNR